MAVLKTIGDALQDGFLMAWQVWWALVLGFAISAIVQAWVPRERVEGALGGHGGRSIGLATAFGAASSSCSYAAVAIAKSLFQKGASAVSALTFQIASTNLVVELGIVTWVLIGWRFALAELIGGLAMIVMITTLLRLFVSERSEERAREHATRAETGHEHHMAGERMTIGERLTSAASWSDVAHNFRNDWQMLWKEIAIGFLLAGFVGQLHRGFFDALFIVHAPAGVRLVENAIVGPLIAVLSFVCSIGNVPVAAVLWTGGIGFAGVIAFIFADLIVLPIVAIYRRYYGTRFALRIVALMLVAMVTAALVVDGLFSAAGIVPRARPTRAEVFAPVTVGYTLWLDLLGLAIFAVLIALTARRGVTDPMCGMRVDRARAVRVEVDGATVFCCSEHCARELRAAGAGGHGERPSVR